MAVNVYPSR